MTTRLTEVRRFSDDKAWVVDILGNCGNSNGYVRPDGTAGPAYPSGKYETKTKAMAAEVLYLAKNTGQHNGVETSAEGSKTRLECLVCGVNSSKGKTKDKKRQGHPEFYKLLERIADLHSRKNHDYSGESDPLKNLRACERLNLKPFLGVLVRLQDKWSRLEEFVKSGQLMVKNESVIDTLMDNAVYSLLAIILYQEQLEKEDNHLAG